MTQSIPMNDIPESFDHEFDIDWSKWMSEEEQAADDAGENYWEAP